MNAAWNCRAFQPGDEAGILELYRDVFRLEMGAELWRWMYLSPPAGTSIIVVLEREGQIVGHYGVQPREFWFAGQRTTVGFAVGTMVRPELRSVGALVEMAQLAYGLCRERGIPWLYAFPNDVAHRVRCALLGWNALPQIVEWDGPLPECTANRSDRVRTWQSFPHELNFDQVCRESECSSAPDSVLIGSARSPAWLRWRFFDRPGGEYVLHTIDDQGRVMAYAVTKRYLRDAINYGHILDWRIAFGAEERSAELLSSIWRQLSQWTVQRVSCWAKGQPVLSKPMEAAGFSMSGRKSNFCYLDLTGARTAELSNAPAWHVEMADSDVY